MRLKSCPISECYRANLQKRCSQFGITRYTPQIIESNSFYNNPIFFDTPGRRVDNEKAHMLQHMHSHDVNSCRLWFCPGECCHGWLVLTRSHRQRNEYTNSSYPSGHKRTNGRLRGVEAQSFPYKASSCSERIGGLALGTRCVCPTRKSLMVAERCGVVYASPRNQMFQIQRTNFVLLGGQYASSLLSFPGCLHSVATTTTVAQ